MACPNNSNDAHLQQPTPRRQVRRVRNFWWPSVQTIEDAKEATRVGAYCASFVGLLTAFIATLNLTGITSNVLGVNAWAYVDASVFLALAYFIFKFSRAAALAALSR